MFLPLLISLAVTAPAVLASTKPNIVLLALDDVGWADVSYHGSNFPTPHIDTLAGSGIRFERMYAMPQCSPTRSALLTGRYAFRTGMQHFTTIFPGVTAGLPFDTPTIAELFAGANYSTHMVGKWHLGYSSWAQTPTRRGFQSYLGYLQGQTDYYNRTMPSCGGLCLYKHNKGMAGLPEAETTTGDGYDFWADETPAIEQFGTYTSESYMDRVDSIISSHKSSEQPFFLYYAEQQLHIPIEPPPEPKHMEACRGVTGGSATVNRTVLCSMASKLDESVGRLVETLKREGLWNNTLIWAVSDNGGMTHWGDNFPASASSNWPLRGGKATTFEGGVRSVSFLSGGYLESDLAGKEYKSLLHVTDVLPTLSHVAGVTVPPEVQLDGINAWDDILGTAGALRRTEVPLNIDTNPMRQVGGPAIMPHHTDGSANFSALIMWPWKLMIGTTCNPGVPRAADVMDGYWGIQNYTRIAAPAVDPGQNVLLFNLELDESEHTDVSADHPDIVANMTQRVQGYWASKDHGFVRSQLNIPLPGANPRYHNWTWSPWRPSIRHSPYYKPKHVETVLQDKFFD